MANQDHKNHSDPVAGSRPQEGAPHSPAHEVEADRLVDERGATIPVESEKSAVNAAHGENTLAATGPTMWWRYGLLLIAILLAIVLILQFVTGGGPA